MKISDTVIRFMILGFTIGLLTLLGQPAKAGFFSYIGENLDAGSSAVVEYVHEAAESRSEIKPEDTTGAKASAFGFKYISGTIQIGKDIYAVFK